MSEVLNYEILKLYLKENNWVVEYQGDDSLSYQDFNDAIVSLGILAKELAKVMKFPLKILIFNPTQELLRESFLFPSLYETNRDKLFKSSFFNKLS